MKVRVSMPGAYIAVDFEDEKAAGAFRKLSETILIIRSKEGKPTREEPRVQNQDQEAEEGSGAVTVRADELTEPEPVEELPEEPEEKNPEPIVPGGYGGFLYIKCPDCGKVKGFCAKVRLNNFRCDCGSVTKLEGLVPLYANCECGRKSRYLTNLEDPVFDMNCYDCGAPVSVSWNPKKRKYETIPR